MQIVTGVLPNADHMRRNYRFYIAPNVNPDGYAYSFTDVSCDQYVTAELYM
jgi:murein tripeptide amidase MpaA